MAKIVKEEETVGFGTNGTGEDAGAEAHPPASAAKVFSREAFQAMQEDRDLSPSLATDEEDETHVSLGRPGKNFFTIHPSPEYELIWPVTYDVRTSGKADPFLVADQTPATLPEV